MNENKFDNGIEMKLEDLFHIRTGVIINRITSKDNDEGCTMSVLSAPDKIKNETIGKSYAKKLSDERKTLEWGDFVINLVYPYQVIKIRGEAGCITNQFHVVLRPKNKCAFDHNYLHLLLYKLSANGDLANCRKAPSSAKAAIISLDKLKNLTISLPNAKKQTEIGIFFSESQKRIRLLEELIKIEEEIIEEEKKSAVNWLTNSPTIENSSKLDNLYKEWKHLSNGRSELIESSWYDFLCDVKNAR